MALPKQSGSVGHGRELNGRQSPNGTAVATARRCLVRSGLSSPVLETARRTQEDVGFEGGFGLQVEFEGFPDIELAFESLARENQGIELFNVRHDEQRTYATVFVPDGKLGHFENLIRDYLDRKA